LASLLISRNDYKLSRSKVKCQDQQIETGEVAKAILKLHISCFTCFGFSFSFVFSRSYCTLYDRLLVW